MSCSFVFVFFFKQKTAYEMRISDWSSDVCSSDLFLQQQDRDAVRAEERPVDLDRTFVVRDAEDSGWKVPVGMFQPGGETHVPVGVGGRDVDEDPAVPAIEGTDHVLLAPDGEHDPRLGKVVVQTLGGDGGQARVGGQDRKSVGEGKGGAGRVG